MFKVKKTSVKKTKRTDQIIYLKQQYTGNIHDDPKSYNNAYANVLRSLADKIAAIDDAWADPEVVVWLHRPGEITAQIMLSPLSKKSK